MKNNIIVIMLGITIIFAGVLSPVNSYSYVNNENTSEETDGKRIQGPKEIAFMEYHKDHLSKERLFRKSQAKTKVKKCLSQLTEELKN